MLPYIHADPVLAKHLEEAGCATVMPLGSPIGSGRGIFTLEEIQIIIENANVPVVVDAGLGAPSDASLALEIGADAVLVNSAIALAQDPVGMAEAFRLGVEAGRAAYLAGRIPRKELAAAVQPRRRHGDAAANAHQLTMPNERLPLPVLMLVTDRKVAGGDDALVRKVDEAVAGGVNVVQLREKDLPHDELAGAGEAAARGHRRAGAARRQRLAPCAAREARR